MKRAFITVFFCAGTYSLVEIASRFFPDARDLWYFFAGMSYMWYIKETEGTLIVSRLGSVK